MKKYNMIVPKNRDLYAELREYSLEELKAYFDLSAREDISDIATLEKALLQQEDSLYPPYIFKEVAVPVEVGARYKDPEGFWEVTGLDGAFVSIKCIGGRNKEGDIGTEASVLRREAAYYLAGNGQEQWAKERKQQTNK